MLRSDESPSLTRDSSMSRSRPSTRWGLPMKLASRSNSAPVSSMLAPFEHAPHFGPGAGLADGETVLLERARDQHSKSRIILYHEDQWGRHAIWFVFGWECAHI